MNNDTVTSLLQLSNTYQAEKEKLINKAPYHLNIIDELHANENAHSRILVKILQYSENNKNINLISFLNYLHISVNPENPIITVEKDRIDACVLDREYALIIENKVNNAVDQEEQLKRYVEIVREKGYEMSQIYVLYLTRWGNKRPTDSSLPPELKEELGDRYHEISFKQDVLPWLEEDVLPKCRFKDRELISALEQYIDYLKGMFNQRYGFEDMNKELEDLLRKELSLSDDNKSNDEILDQKLQELNECVNHLNSMRVELRNKLRKEFLEKLFKKLNSVQNGWVCVNKIHQSKTIEDANLSCFGFKNEQYKFLGTDLVFSIEIQHWNKFLCGVFSENSDAELVVKRELQSKFDKKDIDMTFNNNNWVYLNLDSYNINGEKPAHCIYDDKWNALFAEDMDALVDLFYKNISKVFEAWKAICREN